MQHISELARQRFEHFVIEDETMRAGFAAFPYKILNDTALSVGARLTYAMLLQFAWQAGETFAKQTTLGERIGVSTRQVRRYLNELQEAGYIAIERNDHRFNNTYIIKKLPTKLKKKCGKTR